MLRRCLWMLLLCALPACLQAQECATFCNSSTVCSADCVDGDLLNTCGGFGVCSGGNTPVTPPPPPVPPPASVMDCTALCSAGADCSLDCVDGALLTTCSGFGLCNEPVTPPPGPSCFTSCTAASACDLQCDDAGVATTCGAHGICASEPPIEHCSAVCGPQTACTTGCLLNGLRTDCQAYGPCDQQLPPCEIDSCTGGACDRPASETVDLDCDAVPDTLEFDLADKFFPTVFLQYQLLDIEPAYLAKNWATPYTVQPLPVQGVCDEWARCLELRFAIAFADDCGDVLYRSEGVFHGSDLDQCDHGSLRRRGHPGDSEFYAAVVRREGDWSTAKSDPSQWRLIRDFTSSHWGEGGADSSVHGAYGFCPAACRQWDWDQATCEQNLDHCHWSAGRCAGGTSLDGTPCHLFPVLDGSCAQAGGGCISSDAGCIPNVPNMHCYERNPVSTHRELYSAEGKHALYHTDEECDDGGVTLGDIPVLGLFVGIYGEGADECPVNGYDLRQDRHGLLQNIGWYSSNCAYRDVTIQDPSGCGLYNVWCADAVSGQCDQKFGEATGYSEIFRRRFNWSLPSVAATTAAAPSAPYPVPICGDGICSTEESCESCPTDCDGCLTPSLPTARYLDLDGAEWASRPGGQHTGLTGQTQLTWAFWLQGRGQSGAIASVWQPPDPHRVWRIAADDIGRRLQIYLFDEAVGEPVFVSTDHFMSATSGWHFVVIQFDGGGGPDNDDRIAVWVDDVRLGLTYAGPADVPTALASSTVAPFEVARNGSTFDGRLGEFVIAAGILSPVKRSEWRMQGIDWSDARIVSGYRWDDSLADVVGGNHLTGSGIGGGDYGQELGLPVR